jgi:hypothetical protein
LGTVTNPAAGAEVRRSIQTVEVACGIPSLMLGDSLNDHHGGARFRHRLQDCAIRW